MNRKPAANLVWIGIVCLVMLSSFLEGRFNQTAGKVEYDTAMETSDYRAEIQVGEDGSYTVTEDIHVEFLEPRHGIYRYIPNTGTVNYYDSDKNLKKVPYYGKIELLSANAPVKGEDSNGSKQFRMGREEGTVIGENEYLFSYRMTPQFQDKDYHDAYFNVFPGNWSNAIPKGSSFTITFPKDFDHSRLKFSWGKYGEVKDGSQILDLRWQDNTVTGTLRRSLKFQEGLTFYAPMEAGYFRVSDAMAIPQIFLASLAVAVLGIVAVLFLILGRDEKIYPSIQYQPPQGLDSAAVGFIIDGKAEDRDVISLILYWADQGLLRIEEKKESLLVFHKLRELPQDAPTYQRTMFNRMFSSGDSVSLNSLKHKFAPTISKVKTQIAEKYSAKGTGGIYTRSSVRARRVALLLCSLPFGIFMLVVGKITYTSVLRGALYVILWLMLLAGIGVFCYTVDRWYGRDRKEQILLAVCGLGISLTAVAVFAGSYLMRVLQGEVFNYLPALGIMCVATILMVLLTGFMKKRNRQCTEWMGRLVGLRDFIETAELSRIKTMAEEHPDWFYHVLPYAYIFGLSQVFAQKLKGLAIPAPEWYSTYRHYGYFDYYTFHGCMMHNMRTASQAMALPQPPAPSNTGSHHGGSGGGFSGGGFSGGGFSGGGFGGGGGGSW